MSLTTPRAPLTARDRGGSTSNPGTSGAGTAVAGTGGSTGRAAGRAGRLSVALTGSTSSTAMEPEPDAYFLKFGERESAVSLGNPAHLNFTGELTLEAWIKPESDHADRTGVIIEHGDPHTGSGAEVYLRVEKGQYQTGVCTMANCAATAPMPADDLGNWVHLAGTYGAGGWNLYRNGMLVAQKAANVGSVLVRKNNWAIGAQGNLRGRNFRGHISEVRIWKVCRTQEQIQDAMHQRMAAADLATDAGAGLLALYALDENTGSKAADQCPGAAVGAIQTPKWEAIAPWPMKRRKRGPASSAHLDADGMGSRTSSVSSLGSYDVGAEHVPRFLDRWRQKCSLPRKKIENATALFNRLCGLEDAKAASSLPVYLKSLRGTYLGVTDKEGTVGARRHTPGVAEIWIMEFHGKYLALQSSAQRYMHVGPSDTAPQACRTEVEGKEELFLVEADLDEGTFALRACARDKLLYVNEDREVTATRDFVKIFERFTFEIALKPTMCLATDKDKLLSARPAKNKLTCDIAMTSGGTAEQFQLRYGGSTIMALGTRTYLVPTDSGKEVLLRQTPYVRVQTILCSGGLAFRTPQGFLAAKPDGTCVANAKEISDQTLFTPFVYRKESADPQEWSDSDGEDGDHENFEDELKLMLLPNGDGRPSAAAPSSAGAGGATSTTSSVSTPR